VKLRGLGRKMRGGISFTVPLLRRGTANSFLRRALARRPVRRVRRPQGTAAARISSQKTVRSATARRGTVEGYARPASAAPGPANFTTGKFKVRTTCQRALQTHQDLVNIIRRGMPYHPRARLAQPRRSGSVRNLVRTSLPTFSPDFSTRIMPPSPCRSERAVRHERVHCAREESSTRETGCVKCPRYGSVGATDLPAPTLVDDLGSPHTPDKTSRKSWTLAGRLVPRRISSGRSGTGFNGTPMPSFSTRFQPEQRWAITDFIVFSSRGATGLAIQTFVVAITSRMRSIWPKGSASFESGSRGFAFRSSGQIMEPGRSFHPPATSGHRSGDLRTPTPIALLVFDGTTEREEGTGKNGPSLPVPPEEEEEALPRPRPGRRKAPEVLNSPPTPFARSQTAAVAPVSESPTPWRCQDSFAGLRRAPASPTSSLGTPQSSGRSLVFRFVPSPIRFFSSRVKGSGTNRPHATGDLTGCRELRPGEWSVIFKRLFRATPRAPVSRPESSSPTRLLRLGRGPRTSAVNRRGSHALELHLRRAKRWSHRLPAPMARNGRCFILAIELVVDRAGCGGVTGARARGELGGESLR